MNAMARKSGFGRFGAVATAAVLLALAAIALIPARNIVVGLFNADPAQDSYDWLSRTMAQCEEQAVVRPQLLNFLVVPLEATDKYNDALRAKALSDTGATALFGSQDALQGLRDGALRISSRAFVLHTRDTSNNMTHRWTSASGVSRLSSANIPSDGPFEIRFQISPDDPNREWSTITANGRGTCHWAFALLHE